MLAQPIESLMNILNWDDLVQKRKLVKSHKIMGKNCARASLFSLLTSRRTMYIHILIMIL